MSAMVHRWLAAYTAKHRWIYFLCRLRRKREKPLNPIKKKPNAAVILSLTTCVLLLMALSRIELLSGCSLTRKLKLHLPFRLSTFNGAVSFLEEMSRDWKTERLLRFDTQTFQNVNFRATLMNQYWLLLFQHDSCNVQSSPPGEADSLNLCLKIVSFRLNRSTIAYRPLSIYLCRCTVGNWVRLISSTRQFSCLVG